MHKQNIGLKLCPSCNAFQDATKAECPNCGYDLTNIVNEESFSTESPHGIGWKIYYAFFIFVGAIGVFETFEDRGAFFGLIEIIALFLSSIVLYSWIWAKRIGWLHYIRWLVKLWFYTACFLPFLFLVITYLASLEGNIDIILVIGWGIGFVVMCPAFFAFYCIAWRSRLLYKPS